MAQRVDIKPLQLMFIHCKQFKFVWSKTKEMSKHFINVIQVSIQENNF